MNKEKAELLQAFLDTSKWAMEMFDLIEGEAPIPYMIVINKTNKPT